jgi:uncharacterized membrane protein
MANGTDSSKDLINALIERLDKLESTIRDQNVRLHVIEKTLRLNPIETPINNKTTVPSPPKFQEKAPLYEPLRENKKQANEAYKEEKRDFNKLRLDLESRIGGNWFNKIGVIAIAIGIAFFLKYAIESEWIGPMGRVSLGTIIGFCFLFGAERLRDKGYQNYAHGISGGGILILYLSVYAAINFYKLIDPTTAFIAMTMITTTAVLLSARYNALPIAVLGLIGGFLTPILLARGVDNQIGLFGYIALLDVGVLALAFHKQWRSLNFMSFFATVLIATGWTLRWYNATKLWPTILFYTLFFILFALISILHNAIKRKPTTWLDISLVLINAGLYFSVCYSLLEYRYQPFLGVFALIVSAFYLLLGNFAIRRNKEDRLLIYTFLGLATLFVTLTIPIQMDYMWVTVAWGIEGVILTWIGLRVPDQVARYVAPIVFVVAIAHWLSIDMIQFGTYTNSSFVPLLNKRAVSCIALIGLLVVSSKLYARFGADLDLQEISLFRNLFILTAHFLAFILLTADAYSYFEQKKAVAQANSNWNEAAQIENWRQFVLSTQWIAYGTFALIIGILREKLFVRTLGFFLLAVTACKILFIDTLFFYAASWHPPVFNQTFFVYLLLVISFAFITRTYSHTNNIDDTEKRLALPLFLLLANIFAITGLSLEVMGYFDKPVTSMNDPTTTSQTAQFENAKQLTLTALWTIYGAIALLIGIKRENKLVRFMALSLLGIVILKVFLFDLSALDRIYRIISFIVLGVALLVISFLYQQHQRGKNFAPYQPE